ncbi:MAG: hypothetical protein ACK4UO_07680 [Pseudolabrys sp.]
MLANLARGAYLIMVAVMLVAYAASVASAPEPEPQKPATRMYS